VIWQNGFSYGETTRLLKRPKSTVHRAFKEMEREGILGQLCLPGFEPEQARDGE